VFKEHFHQPIAQRRLFDLITSHFVLQEVFSTILLYSAATRSNITKSPVLSQDFLSLFLR
ncbi:hypothetical protein ABE205_05950, partial [Brevibacillus agri]|uniref:hypothetical protein n=1 Tax=Brevibacillus agri TaxID=51101 RepID=UPI003D1B0E6E